MAIEDGQLTMDQILSGEAVTAAQPEPEPAEERVEQSEQVAAEPTSPQQPESSEAAPAAAGDEGDELPPWLDPERDPDQAGNWRELKATSKDFRRQARENAERAEAEKAAREAASTELEALRAEVAAMRQAATQPRPPELPPIEDAPAAHIAALDRRLQAQQASQAYDKSEVLAIHKHGMEKVEQAFSKFEKLPPNDPLRIQIQQSADPWNLVVAEIDRRELLTEIGGDPAQYRAKVESELRAQVEAEFAAKAQAVAAEGVERTIRDRLPSSMAKVPGSGQKVTGGDWNGPAPMGEIIGSGLDRYN